MDFQHFDRVTRALSSVGTRRRALGLLTALPVVGGLLALPGAEDVLAKHRHHHHVDQEKKKKKKKKKKKACKPQSTATVCAGKCGTVSNALTCNKPVNCGPCDCLRTTCAAQGKTCGTISDSCGGSLACGSCSNPTPVCTDNVCVACSDDAECGDGLVCCHGSCAAGWTNQTTFGSNGSGADQFSSPYGVAVLAGGLTSLVADTGNGRIKIWTRPDAASTSWSYLTAFGGSGGPNPIQVPEGIAVSPDGLTAWVADIGCSCIAVWTRPDANSTDWVSQTSFGGRGVDPNQFRHPTSVAVSGDGLTAWVADSDNNRVGVWTRPDASSTAWTNQTTFGSEGDGADQFVYPCGVAVSADGRTVWVADTGNYRISIWTRPDATSTAWANDTTFGSEGTGASQFFSPFGLAISPDALTLWVADTDNHRVAVWSRPDASSMTWSNQALFGERGSGAGQLDAPFGVALLPGGQSVLVVDGNNDRVSIWGQGCSA